MKLLSVATAIAALAAGCSDADLYSKGVDPFVPNRIAVRGEICTEDTGGSRFPTKVLVMVDGSAEAFKIDPLQERVAAVEDLVQRSRNQPHVRFGFVRVAGASQAVPSPDGQQFVPPTEDLRIQAALASLRAFTGEGQRNVMNAIAQAEAFITSDIAKSPPGEVLRSRYLVYLLLTGPSNPNFATAELAARVERVRDLVYELGALQFQFNVGLLYYGPRSVGAAPNYNCYPPSGGACTCPPAVGDEYCAVICDTPPSGPYSEARMDTAREQYRSITFVGQGRMEEFACPAGIQVGVNIGTGAVELVKKDIVAFNANVRLDYNGTVIDSDADGLSDAEEVTVGTNPVLWDSDNDGIGDRVELRTAPRQNPLNPFDRPTACVNPATNGGQIPDTDRDLLADCEEGLVNASPSIPDTDGDGLPDWLEFMAGTLSGSAQDRLLDSDVDGVINGDEVIEHTNPRSHDSLLRGSEAYRNSVSELGQREVATMEDSEELPAVVFLSASPNVVGGQAQLTWDAAASTLAWSDARYNQSPPFNPTPVVINGNGRYVLTAQSPNGELIWIEVAVNADLLPTNGIEANPLITVSKRNCYGVRISNIKLMETKAVGADPDGMNRIYVFFTQAPLGRLTSPGISQVAQVNVRFKCADPDDVNTCKRNPDDVAVDLSTEQFVSTWP